MRNIAIEDDVPGLFFDDIFIILFRKYIKIKYIYIYILGVANYETDRNQFLFFRIRLLKQAPIILYYNDLTYIRFIVRR